VALRVLRGAGAPAGAVLYIRGHNNLLGPHMSDGTSEDGTLSPPGFNTFSTTNVQNISTVFTTPRRYVSVFGYNAGALYTAGDEDTVRILGARLFANTSYVVAGATPYDSGLTASTAIKASRARLPLLSADESRIATVAFTIPHAAWIKEDATEREQQEAFNAYHGYRLGVDAERRVFFQPQPSTPRLQVDASDFGVDYVPTSTNDGTEIYNEVSVRGRSGSGVELRVDRMSADFVSSGDVPASDLAVANGTLDVNATGWINATRTTTNPRDGAGALLVTSYAVGDMTGAGTFKARRTYRVSGYMRLDPASDPPVKELDLFLGEISAGIVTDGVYRTVALTTPAVAGYVQWSILWTPEADRAGTNVKITIATGHPGSPAAAAIFHAERGGGYGCRLDGGARAGVAAGASDGAAQGESEHQR
jgi:hypothetical protein